MEKISPILVAFGQAVKQQHRTRGITQEELVKRCHLDRSYISHIERGLKNPSLSVLWEIANALDFRQITHSRSLQRATSNLSQFEQLSLDLLLNIPDLIKGVRLIGVSVANFQPN